MAKAALNLLHLLLAELVLRNVQVANIRQGMDVGMLLTGIPLVVITRALNIYPLAFLVNKGASFFPGRSCTGPACLCTVHNAVDPAFICTNS